MLIKCLHLERLIIFPLIKIHRKYLKNRFTIKYKDIIDSNIQRSKIKTTKNTKSKLICIKANFKKDINITKPPLKNVFHTFIN